LYLGIINDAQLELENLSRDIKTSKQMFSDPGALRTALSKMRSYLGKLIKEYEKAFETLPRPTSFALTALPRLEGFTATSAKCDFKEQFSDPYREILGAIRRDLLPNLPNTVQAIESGDKVKINAAEARGESIINAEVLQKYAPDELVVPKPQPPKESSELRV
jgi:hypothetical protein